MLPAERQTYIKELIQAENHIKISELSKRLNVSDMTIHRDVKVLIDEGVVVKTFGGISKNVPSTPSASDINKCVCCYRDIHERMSFHLILTDFTMEKACCAHCGLLRYRQVEGKLSQAICHDFLSDVTIDAHMAWYVMHTSIDINCCTPQILTFKQEGHAKQFIKGFGGAIYSFVEAMEQLLQTMDANRKSCHQVQKATDS